MVNESKIDFPSWPQEMLLRRTNGNIILRSLEPCFGANAHSETKYLKVREHCVRNLNINQNCIFKIAAQRQLF